MCVLYSLYILVNYQLKKKQKLYIFAGIIEKEYKYRTEEISIQEDLKNTGIRFS